MPHIANANNYVDSVACCNFRKLTLEYLYTYIVQIWDTKYTAAILTIWVAASGGRHMTNAFGVRTISAPWFTELAYLLTQPKAHTHIIITLFTSFRNIIYIPCAAIIVIFLA